MPGDEAPDRDLDSALSNATALGIPAMAALVDAAEPGIVVVDDRHRYVYANPAACRMLGHQLSELRGTDLLAGFLERDRPSVLAGLVAGPGATDSFSAILLDPGGVEREVVCSTFAIEVNGRAHGVVVIWDFTAPRETARTALALAQTAAQMVDAGEVEEILTSLARHAVEGSAALSCGISVVAQDHTLAAAGAYGPPGPGYGHANPAWVGLADTPVEQVIEAMTVGRIAFADPPGPPVVVPDARPSWEANPVTRPFAANLSSLDWRGGVYVPLSWENKVVGFLAIFLPAGLASPSEQDLALYRVLADQAAVVVMNGRFAAQAGNAAVLLERSRLARELHDSVSQGLFSMTMHARAAQLSLANAGFAPDDPIARSVSQLSELTRGALAEMRALIFELRPDALTEEGLLGALRRVGTALFDQSGPAFTVHGPDGNLQLSSDSEQHLYRIATEALNNVAKHSRARHVSVRVSATSAGLRMTISDDGAGFDAASAFPGHLGMSTMAQRARAIGAEYTVSSGHGMGTAVEVTLPRREPAQG